MSGRVNNGDGAARKRKHGITTAQMKTATATARKEQAWHNVANGNRRHREEIKTPLPINEQLTLPAHAITLHAIGGRERSERR